MQADKGSMAVLVEMHHTGDPALRSEVVAAIEHVFADRPGDWRVSIVGSQANDRWEMKIAGPNGFERSYTLEGSVRQHEPVVIRAIVGKMVAVNVRVEVLALTALGFCGRACWRVRVMMGNLFSTSDPVSPSFD
jgi:hypothetical protein